MAARVFNNTFYLNGKGIETTDINLNIINNAFFQDSSSTAISPTVALLAIKNNLFFGGIIGPAVGNGHDHSLFFRRKLLES